MSGDIRDDLWWFMMIYGPFMESATETMFACHACRARHPCRHRSPNYWPHHYGKKWFGLIRKISVIIHELCQSVLWHWSSLVNCYSHMDPQDHPSDLKTSRLVGLKLLLWDNDDWWDHAAPNWLLFFFLPWRIDRHGLVICSCGLSHSCSDLSCVLEQGFQNSPQAPGPFLPGWLDLDVVAIVEAMVFPNTTWAMIM